MRRHFELPESDRNYLEASRLPWETIREDGALWVLVHCFPVPPGYNHAQVTAAIQIAPGYPDAPLDMVSFYPDLCRTDGGWIGRFGDQPLDGRMFQRWSRHRTPENSWRPGLDDLSSHLLLAASWLQRQLLTGRAE